MSSRCVAGGPCAICGTRRSIRFVPAVPGTPSGDFLLRFFKINVVNPISGPAHAVCASNHSRTGSIVPGANALADAAARTFSLHSQQSQQSHSGRNGSISDTTVTDVDTANEDKMIDIASRLDAVERSIKAHFLAETTFAGTTFGLTSEAKALNDSVLYACATCIAACNEGRARGQAEFCGDSEAFQLPFAEHREFTSSDWLSAHQSIMSVLPEDDVLASDGRLLWRLRAAQAPPVLFGAGAPQPFWLGMQALVEATFSSSKEEYSLVYGHASAPEVKARHTRARAQAMIMPPTTSEGALAGAEFVLSTSRAAEATANTAIESAKECLGLNAAAVSLESVPDMHAMREVLTEEARQAAAYARKAAQCAEEWTPLPRRRAFATTAARSSDTSGTSSGIGSNKASSLWQQQQQQQQHARPMPARVELGDLVFVDPLAVVRFDPFIELPPTEANFTNPEHLPPLWWSIAETDIGEASSAVRRANLLAYSIAAGRRAATVKHGIEKRKHRKKEKQFKSDAKAASAVIASAAPVDRRFTPPDDWATLCGSTSLQYAAHELLSESRLNTTKARIEEVLCALAEGREINEPSDIELFSLVLPLVVLQAELKKLKVSARGHRMQLVGRLLATTGYLSLRYRNVLAELHDQDVQTLRNIIRAGGSDAMAACTDKTLLAECAFYQTLLNLVRRQTFAVAQPRRVVVAPRILGSQRVKPFGR